MPTAHGFPRIGHASIEYDNDTGFTSTVTTAGTPVVIANAGLTAGPADSEGMFTVAATSGTITCNFTGTVLAQVAVALKPGTDADTVEITITKGGTSVGVSARQTTPTVLNTLETIATQACIAVTKGDVLDVRHDSNNNSDTATINSFSFVCLELERV